MTAGTRPLVEDLTSDSAIAEHFQAKSELWAMRHFEAELAAAQADLGLIPSEAGHVIHEKVLQIPLDMDAIRRGMAKDGVAVPALVRELRRLVGEPHAVHIHMGATSQDAIDTGLMLRLKLILQILDHRLETLLDHLANLSAEQGETKLMAQTRMQAALPFTAADKLATWARPLESHRARLAGLGASLPLQLGGPIGNGDSFGEAYLELRAALGRRLGLRDAPPWQSDRTPVLDVAQGFALMTGTLGKMGQDLALMAQNEVGAVRLPGGGASSAMAHKQNPVGAEVLVALARLNAGHLGTLAQSMVHENERSGAAWTLEWLILPGMAEAAGASLRHAATLLAGLQFQPA